jgi:uncharacterized protein YdcH (DUF465 family)
MQKPEPTLNPSKIERIRSVIARFAENEDSIRELMQTDPRFDALCEEYATVGNQLDELTRSKYPIADSQASELQKRRVALEEELLATIEGYRPV